MSQCFSFPLPTIVSPPLSTCLSLCVCLQVWPPLPPPDQLTCSPFSHQLQYFNPGYTSILYQIIVSPPLWMMLRQLLLAKISHSNNDLCHCELRTVFFYTHEHRHTVSSGHACPFADDPLSQGWAIVFFPRGHVRNPGCVG